MANHDMEESEPDWIDQACSKLSDLYATLEVICDPTCLEACESLNDALDRLIRQQNMELDG